MKRIVLAMFLVSGCGVGFTTPRPGQDKVIKRVWHGLYGMKQDPPTINWVPVNDREHWDQVAVANCYIGDIESDGTYIVAIVAITYQNNSANENNNS